MTGAQKIVPGRTLLKPRATLLHGGVATGDAHNLISFTTTGPATDAVHTRFGFVAVTDGFSRARALLNLKTASACLGGRTKPRASAARQELTLRGLFCATEARKQGKARPIFWGTGLETLPQGLKPIRYGRRVKGQECLEDLSGGFQRLLKVRSPRGQAVARIARPRTDEGGAFAWGSLLERIQGKFVVIGAIVGRGSEDLPQAEGFEQCGLEDERGLFKLAVAVGFVVEAPIDPAEGFLASNQGVAELVENHLCERIVRVEARGVAQRYVAEAVRRGIGVRTSRHPKADGVGRAPPNFFERVAVTGADLTLVKGCGHEGARPGALSIVRSRGGGFSYRPLCRRSGDADHGCRSKEGVENVGMAE